MRGRLGSRLAVAAAVVFALAVAGWQAELHWSARNPQPLATIGIGETVEVDGSTYRLDSVTAEPRLPTDDPEQPWAEALDGALLVQVIITTEIVGEGVNAEEHYCFATAQDAAGRRWQPDTTVGHRATGPEATSCRGTLEETIRPGEPLQVGFVFMVPADAVDTLTFELELGYEDGTLLLTA